MQPYKWLQHDIPTQPLSLPSPFHLEFTVSHCEQNPNFNMVQVLAITDADLEEYNIKPPKRRTLLAAMQ